MSKHLYHSISKLYTMKGGIRTKDNLNDAHIIEDAYILAAHMISIMTIQLI